VLNSEHRGQTISGNLGVSGDCILWLGFDGAFDVEAHFQTDGLLALDRF